MREDPYPLALVAGDDQEDQGEIVKANTANFLNDIFRQKIDDKDQTLITVTREITGVREEGRHRIVEGVIHADLGQIHKETTDERD